MKEIKKRHGISLIVLIITIIVIIILATAVILSLANNNPIENAKNAVSANNKAVIEEQKLLFEAQYELEKSNIGSSTGDSISQKTKGEYVTEKILEKTYNQKIEVGDYVNYDSGVEPYIDENGWQVLGFDENGQIMLLATNWYKGTSEGGEFIELTGRDGYKNMLTILQEASNKYAQGKYADYARSIKVEDVDYLTGYDPKVNKWKINSTEDRALTAYGDTVTYTYDSNATLNVTSKLYPEICTFEKTFTNDETFYYFNENTEEWESYTPSTMTETMKKTIVGNIYYYTCDSTQATDDIVYQAGIEETKIYEMLFGISARHSTDQYKYEYFLANREVLNGRYGYNAGYRFSGRYGVSFQALVNTPGGTAEVESSGRLRPIVVLDSNVVLKPSSSTVSDDAYGNSYNVWDITK